MPYCSHCKNIGLSFTDHWLKDGNKKIQKLFVLCYQIQFVDFANKKVIQLVIVRIKK